MENHALNAAHEIIRLMTDEGLFGEDGLKNYDESVAWVANIISTEFGLPPIGFISHDDITMEFGEGDGTDERLRDEP